MQAMIEISEETLNRLSGSLSLPPLYETDCIHTYVNEDLLSYAIKLMVDLCVD